MTRNIFQKFVLSRHVIIIIIIILIRKILLRSKIVMKQEIYLFIRSYVYVFLKTKSGLENIFIKNINLGIDPVKIGAVLLLLRKNNND